MLIEFKVKNFRSFREEQTFSMVADAAAKDEKHPDNLIDCGGSKLVKTAAIFGANASGKSNLIKALDFVKTFVSLSATRMNLGDSIYGVVPFRLDAEWTGKPCSFELTILLDGTHYVYGFTASREKVHEEWLRVKPAKGRLATWFFREGEDWEVKGPLEKDAALLRERTRDNGLALSRGAELNIEALRGIFHWFSTCLWVYDLSAPLTDLTEITASVAGGSGPIKARILKFLQDADLGIATFDVSEEKESPLLRLLAETSEIASTKHSISTLHRVSGTDALVAFRLDQDESKGTQRFFSLAGPILAAIALGNVMVLDELDCSMHPLLTRMIVRLFQSPEANKKGAQLIFATHDTNLMSPTLMRRDQIWFAEKDQAGATKLFSLYDFEDRPRSDSAFAKNYLAGRYGAVPSFGPSLEDSELPKE